jgi:glutamate racemase
MLDRGIETVVLGCTHYPFVIPLIEQIVGENVRVIDPAPAVAKQVKRLLAAGGMKNPVGERTQVNFYTSGAVDAFQFILPKLLRERGDVRQVVWLNDRKVQPTSYARSEA